VVVSSNDNDGDDGSDGQLQVVVMLLAVMISIGRTSKKKMRSEWLASLFFSFWCLMPKGEKLDGSIIFDAMMVVLQLELHVIFDKSS
jgi:hypothetical protein